MQIIKSLFLITFINTSRCVINSSINDVLTSHKALPEHEAERNISRELFWGELDE